MRIPMSPPDPAEILGRMAQAEDGAKKLLEVFTSGLDPAPHGRYRHWDVQRHLPPPNGMTSEEWWLGIKVARRQLYRQLPLRDKNGAQFRFAVVDPGLRMLQFIDQQAGGAVRGSELVTDSHTRDTYIIKSLMEEAITSSQLEGASTTREVAKDMLQRGHKPRDRSEQMIYNNYQAMLFIRSVAAAPLTPKLIFELHRILTQDTLDDPTAAGRLRRADEVIQVVDDQGTLLHSPPLASELEERLSALCRFANDRTGEPFVHAVVRAIVLHFGLAYDHPFVDGNGRTARALFYWAMSAQGYWLCESISISRIIKRAPSKYARAFLYTETDEGDTTYFILNQLRVTVRAIKELHAYLEQKAREIRATRAFIQQSAYINAALNHRQLAVLNHAMRNPGFIYGIVSHQRSHNVSYQTARTDLLELAEHGLLERGKSGKAFVFIAPKDLRAKLQLTDLAAARG